MVNIDKDFSWERFLQPYELAVEDFILKMEGIKHQYLLANQYCPIEIVSGRVKSPQSILDKAQRLNVDKCYIDEQLYDIGGVRITCKYLSDVYKVCELVKQRKDLETLEIRDYIKNPKPSGYRSLHLIVQVPIFLQKNKKMVNVEVQFRTIAMDFWASLEHKLRYKKDIPEDQAQQLQEELLACATQSAQLDERMQEIRNQLVSKFGE